MKKMRRYTFLSAVLAITVFLGVSLSPSTGDAALLAVSPDNAVAGTHIGYPLWYQDFTGLKLGPCVDPVGLPGVCIGPPTPGATADQVDFEDFYWIIESDETLATAPPTNLATMRYRAALEMATFPDTPILTPPPVDRLVFHRVQIRLNVVVPGTYTVQHPFGSHNLGFLNAGDSGNIRVVDDLGAGFPDNFNAVVTLFVGNTFPTWTPDPALAAPPLNNNYIGNLAIPHTITPGPAGATLTVTGPAGAFGPGRNSITTDLFNVAGQIFAPANRAPVVTLDNATFPPITAGAGAVVTRTARVTDPDNNAIVAFTATLTPPPAVGSTWFSAVRQAAPNDNQIVITITPNSIPAADNNKVFTLNLLATDTGIPSMQGSLQSTFTVGTAPVPPAPAAGGGGGGGGCAVAGVTGDWKDGLGGIGLLALVAIGLSLRRRLRRG